VAGIVAARLVERYGRPSVVVGFEDGEGKGSARTIGGFDVGAAMRSCSDHIVAGGGHAGAAGLTVRQDRFDDFRQAFVAAAEAGMPEGGYCVDVDIAADVGLGDIDGRLVDELKRLEPFGKDNPEPVFAARGVLVDEVRVLKGEHLKCTLRDSDGGAHLRSAIGFGLADRAPAAGDRVDAAFTVGWNVWRGRKELQLTLEDIRPEEPR
jgi:single-stranded-DNA-specific exonuclease